MSPEEIEKIPVHFILCTERTGSSLLSLILNLHPQILSPSEEPFALFFYKAYKDKVKWSEQELHRFIDEFWLMAEKSLGLLFTSKERLFDALAPHKDHLPYTLLVRLIYLQFIEPKPKDDIRLIVDKQIKYFFYLPELLRLFPDARFVVLVRDPLVNAQRKKLRKLNSGSSAIYLAALWKNTYRNFLYLKKHHKQTHVVTYENFVSEPEQTVKGICDFLGISFLPQMLQTEGFYEQLLEVRKDKISDAFYHHLRDFHSGLLRGIHSNTVKPDLQETDEALSDKITGMNEDLLKAFGYPAVTSTKARLSLDDRWQIFKAKLYRPLLIRYYLHIPLGIKLLIKRIRGVKPH